MTRYEIRLRSGIHPGPAENVWTCEGEPETFGTEQEARAALADHLAACVDTIAQPETLADFELWRVSDDATEAEISLAGGL